MTAGFADRFALARFDDGAVLVDLVAGDIHESNGTAAAIWARLIECNEIDATSRELAGQWNVDLTVLRRDIDTMVATISSSRLRSGPSDRSDFSIRWRREERGDILEAGGIPCARIVGERRIELLAGAELVGVVTTLVWVAPHALMAQGRYVLHASGVGLADGTVHAFVGASGAGKTTTAQAIAAASGEAVSEDLVVTSAGDGDPRCDVWIEGEARIREWAVRSARAGHDVVDVCELAAMVCAGPRKELGRVLLLDVSRRCGVGFELRRLGSTAACVALLVNSFAERAREVTWRTAFTGSSAIARGAAVVQAGAPDGLDALRRAAVGYSTISMS